VRAVNEVGRRSSSASKSVKYSVVAPVDSSPPTQPGTPTAKVVSSSEIDLSWGASSDNVGVTGYQVERNSVQIATPSGISYNDAGVSGNTSYTYTVRAVDAKGNVSADSNPVTATTPPGPPPPTCNGYVALTYDDGPTSMTQQYINSLSAGGARATFFLLGNQMQSFPTMAAAEVAAGNAIGDHTMDHKSFTGDSDGLGGLTDSQITSEVQGQANLAQSQAGYTENLFRPPYGDMTQHTFDVVNRLGFTSVMWTYDTNDWQNPTTSAIVNGVVANARNQAVILMHDGHQNTLNAIPQILSGLKSKGLCPGQIVPDPTNADNQFDYNGLPMNLKVIAWPNS
jgi:peptidoglycan/xylan/chitin deacetylase (PgdA/CDA1 family)